MLDKQVCNIYKNTKLKLLKTNAVIWFSKMCKIKQLKPNYIHFRTNSKTIQDRRTTTHAIIYRINQELKFLYCKKQTLNTQLYRLHLECAHQCNGVWQHVYNSIETKLNHILDTLYHKLNKKLDRLTHQSQTIYNNKENKDTQPRLINLTPFSFQKELVNTLTLGPNYAIGKPPKQYINEHIVDTESAIRQLNPKIQSPLRYLAATKIKQILTSNAHDTLHKRYQYNINQVKDILHKNNLRIVRADKNKAMAIIQKDALEQKLNTFIQENHITQLKKDPTETFQK